MTQRSIQKCLERPVIPVVWDPGKDLQLISHASSVFLQGGDLADAQRVLNTFRDVPSVAVFAHIDLIAGLENSEAGIEYLSKFDRLSGIVTVHHHLAKSARRLGLLSIVRLFVSDSRAVERGLAVASKSGADAIEILPAAAAVKVADEFKPCPLPRIAGGLCRTETDVREALDSGCRAVTSTRSALWRLNER
jgi:glycerol uptake operon antiterminator